MRLNYQFILVFFTFLMVGCDKTVEPPSGGNSNPVFVNEMEIDGNTIKLEAGVNEYNAIADYQIINDELVFSAYIKPVGCDRNCPESIEFLIGSSIPHDRDFTMKNAMMTGRKLFFEQIGTGTGRDSLVVFVRDKSTGNSQGRYWELNGQRTEPVLATDSLIFTMPAIGNHELCLTHYDVSRNESKHCQTFRNGRTDVPKTFIRVNDPGIVVLEAIPIQPYDEKTVVGKWNYGINKDFKLSIKPTDIKSQSFCFESKWEGLIGNSCLKINDDIRRVNVNSIFNIEKTSIKKRALPWKDKVQIKFTDKTRKLFASDARMSTQGRFEIVELVPFENDAAGKKYLKATILFNVVLSDGMNILKVSKGKASIPIIDLD